MRSLSKKQDCFLPGSLYRQNEEPKIESSKHTTHFQIQRITMPSETYTRVPHLKETPKVSQ